MWNNNTIEDEIQRNSLEYGVAVNSDRAIPDAKSGLKPVARRIIYDMFDNGIFANKPHLKSARVYGDVMGRLHPHGDSSIYLAMVRLAQDWIMRYPLIDGHGNFGNILGDGPAAGRYTEVRLTKLAEDGLTVGLKKKNVDFTLTYDETEEEPITLPAIFPNLLCNPNEGIGWAMGCSWAPHNLIEVAQAINDYLDGVEPMLPGPDFPTGGIVINKNDIPLIMKTGHGSVKVRGRYKIDKQKIIFYEIPYGTRLESLMSEIGAAADEGKIEGIVDISNESSKKELRLVIEVDKKNNPENIVKQLFQKTNLQSSFSYNQVALIGKTPTELNLKDAIKVYVDHNIDCLLREAKFDLKKAEDRLHIVEGLLKALINIDDIIHLIKTSESTSVAKDNLIKIYSFSEVQAKAILDMKLAKLAKLERVTLENEKAELDKTIKEINNFITNKDLQIKKLKERLSIIVKKYGDKRRTELVQIELPKEEKEIQEVVPEDVVVITTKTGLIKRVPLSNFKVQRRGGKGVKNKDDAILDLVKTNTIDTMMFFSTKGKMYRILVDNIPIGTNTTKGVPINSLIKLESDESIVAVTSLHRKTTANSVVFVTKNGLIKKTALSDYMKTNRNNGIIAIGLKEGDSVVDVTFLEDEEIILITKNGMSIRFMSKEVPLSGRATKGVKAIKLNEGDEVISILPIHKDTDEVAVFSKSGLGKKCKLTEFSLQARGGKGLLVYKTDDAEGKTLVGAEMLSDEDNLLLIGNKTSICISAVDVPTLSRTGIGNILIKNNILTSVVKL